MCGLPVLVRVGRAYVWSAPTPPGEGIIRFVKMCEYTAAHVRDASRYV